MSLFCECTYWTVGIFFAVLFLIWFFLFKSPSPNYKKKFENKVVVITGASSGIGYELAKQLSAYHPKLVLAARTVDKLETLKQECETLGAKEVLLVATDVSKTSDCKNLVEQTVKKFNVIDVLFLNAGVALATTVQKAENPEVLAQIMKTNYFGATETAFYALPHLRDSGGHIVVTSSVVSKLVLRGASAYCASKAAVNSFFDCLRKEERNINITIVCPGYVPTEVVANSLTGDGSKSGRSHKLHFPMQLKPAVQLMISSVASNKMEVWYTLPATILMSLRGGFPNAIDRLMGKFGF